MYKPRVLLISKAREGTGHLYRRFQSMGCDCRYATSRQEAQELVTSERFDLILSPDRLGGENMFSLMELVDGTPVTLYYSHVTEDGSYWVPAFRAGERCLGSAALRPSELVEELDRILADVRRRYDDERAPAASMEMKKPARPMAPSYAYRKAAG